MSKEEIITQITSNGKYLSICRKLLRGDSLYKDLFQDLLLLLLEQPQEKLIKIECVDCYIYKTLSNMVNSSTSRFHYKYRRRIDTVELALMQEETYNHSIDKKSAQAQKIINKLSWHDKKIMQMWVDGKSDRTIGTEKNIPRYFITKKIKTITTQIKQEIKMQELESPIKILLVVQRQTTALEYHRQYIPHERLQKTNGNDFKIEFTHGEGEEASIDGMTDEQLKEYQIVYYLRQISFHKEKIQPTLDRLHRLGLKVVLDIDDFWFLPPEHHWYQMYKDKGVADITIDTLKKVDWVVTTTSFFADRIKEHNKNITVLPNCISPDATQFTQRKIESPRLRFGWIGGVFHKPDIDEMADLFKLLNNGRAKDFRNDFQVSVGGFSCNYEYKEIEKTFTANYSFRNTDTTYYNYLQQCTPTMEHISFDKPYRRLWGRDIRTYGELYNEIDVALVPLKENTFNKCKSELKVVEAGWMKKAVICSRITPYQEVIKHEVNGLLINPARNNIDWFCAIRRLTLNPHLAEDMGEALHETITEKFDLDVHNKTRAELYKSLI